MINVSQAYREAVRENREFCIADEVTFPDGSELTFSTDDLMAYSINEATSESGKFQIGAAVIKEYSATLDNSEGKFDRYQFDGTDIQAKIGLKLADGSWEYLDKGTYRIVQAKQVDLTISIKAYDNMLYFDRPYSESSLTYPASINQIIQDASIVCQVAYDASSIVNGNLIIPERPKDDAITFRDVISFCAQLMGCYAKINHLDALEFSWYPDTGIGIIDAGVAKNGAYPSTDDIIDGGSFSSMPENIISAGDISDTLAYHHFYDLKGKSINTDDITITGIQVAVYKEKDQVVQYGSDGYVIAIEDNPLIQNSDIAQTVAQTAGASIIGMSFRPLSVTAQSDPCIEAGDSAIISEDWKKPAVSTVITNTTFSFGGGQKIDCTAETPTEKTYTRYSAKTRIIAESKQDTEEQMNAYDLAVKQMNQLAANTFGFFSTTVPQPDGSVIAYRHDKKNLSDSKIVYKSGLDGFWVTRNYTGNDNTTVWENGFDSSGNAVMNILSVIGINFSWANGGTLTLGGGGNGNGRLVILNASGAQIGYIDNTGANLNKGSFAGSLSAATGTFSGDLSAAGGTFSGNLQAAGGTFKGTLQAGKVTGSTIEGSVLSTYFPGESSSGIVIEEGRENFYYEYDHFGYMEPANDFMIDEGSGTTTEWRYLYFSCDVMVRQIFNSSDERKKDIKGWNDEYDAFLMDLQPIEYTWKEGETTKIHTGLGAQTTKKLLGKHGLTNSSLVAGRKETSYTIAYSELHAMEIASIQKNRKLIESLSKKIETLEALLKDKDGDADGNRI